MGLELRSLRRQRQLRRLFRQAAGLLQRGARILAGFGQAVGFHHPQARAVVHRGEGRLRQRQRARLVHRLLHERQAAVAGIGVVHRGGQAQQRPALGHRVAAAARQFQRLHRVRRGQRGEPGAFVGARQGAQQVRPQRRRRVVAQAGQRLLAAADRGLDLAHAHQRVVQGHAGAGDRALVAGGRGSGQCPLRRFHQGSGVSRCRAGHVVHGRHPTTDGGCVSAPAGRTPGRWCWHARTACRPAPPGARWRWPAGGRSAPPRPRRARAAPGA